MSRNNDNYELYSMANLKILLSKKIVIIKINFDCINLIQ